MLIATDIGNSSITIGYFTAQGLIVQRIPTLPIRNSEQYRAVLHAFIKENNIEKGEGASIISSVVSSHTGIFVDAVEGLPGQGKGTSLLVTHLLSGIGFRIPHPDKLGTDRIANAVAAFSLVRRPVAVADFGTATTLTVVDGNGDVMGGAIMPGISLMNEALGTRTAKLTKVGLRAPDAALGVDTDGCILSGLVFGTAGAVQRILAEIENETSTSYEMILTGGQCELIGPFIERAHTVRPDLTLEGLKILYEKNRP
ncbi:MAG: type III pantothenate kinase [Nitrospirae bacterium]|nr:type III pantothenate kinase [Nitrospirota bacterium]